MITVSVCMIVKNEENVLARCLDSLEGLYEELIIVDTGSTDSTREIAKKYTDKIYDFMWVGDFSKARNFSISKATMDYIYVPDADEVLDEENRNRFKLLKQNLLPEIEIVEMRYVNQLSNGTVYNFDKEYRPKLYKRLREFTFIEPVHEMVRLDPVVFESDIDIIHMPESVHGKRDLEILEREAERNGVLSERLTLMFAKELLMTGDSDDFLVAKDYFARLAASTESGSLLKASCIILAKTALLTKDTSTLLKYSLKDIAGDGSSEMCSILGAFYEEEGDYEEAAMWYYNARYETEAELCLKYKEDLPLEGLSRVYRALGEVETAIQYETELKGLKA